jgi:hypothetical protein
MSYYKDVKFLVYVRRGAYTAGNVVANVEKYQMLRILMATAFRDVEPNARVLCRATTLTWHDDHCLLEIDMPRARWESRFGECAEIQAAMQELSSIEHDYCVEMATVDPENVRNCYLHASKQVKNPLLSLHAQAKVNL